MNYWELLAKQLSKSVFLAREQDWMIMWQTEGKRERWRTVAVVCRQVFCSNVSCQSLDVPVSNLKGVTLGKTGRARKVPPWIRNSDGEQSRNYLCMPQAPRLNQNGGWRKPLELLHSSPASWQWKPCGSLMALMSCLSCVTVRIPLDHEPKQIHLLPQQRLKQLTGSHPFSLLLCQII